VHPAGSVRGVTVASASARLAREWAARDGHFITAYAAASWYQVTVAGCGRFHAAGSPVSGSNSRPVRAARTSSARWLSASLLVMKDFDLLRPAAC
jgi:hypothetical protein